MLVEQTIIPVLLYHGVRDAPVAGLERWTLSQAAFAEHVEAIAVSGRTPMLMSQLAACLRGQAVLPANPMAITFDDGWDDTLPAVALLAERGLPSTTYLQTGRIGAADFLDADGVRALDELGDAVEVGAHSIDHPRLDELAGAALEREVAGSKAALEDLLSHPVDGFAYPHGAHDARSRAAVIAAGFSHAAAVKDALSHAGDDLFAIARWTVTAEVDASRLRAVLAGDGVPTVRAGDRPRTIAYRTVRRLRRRLTGARA